MKKFFSYKPQKGNFGKIGELEFSNPANDRYLSLAKSIRNWQLAFLVMSCLAGGCLISYVNLANRTKLVPYVIEINKENGTIYYTGKMIQENYAVNDSIIFSILNDHVVNTRSISLDQVFTYKKFKRQYAFLTAEMKNKMSEEIQGYDLDKKYKNKEAIDVTITSMLKENDAYRINWTEKKYVSGSNTEIKKMTGIFSVEQVNNLSEEDITINPLQILIKDFSITTDKSY
ncbi:MAG: type IV secretion system protein [Fusobacterium gastrosuis]|uniref:VirB8/TrbF family protein n=1 Tax=Fusobacterium gastrosuis TaxID=1755100 RepID=UPI002979F1B8|nr:type IV secretion system protein [Fusobacteriaceae bacterium]MDY4010997.1 type IV secretion system protein [Fusobacterium gastrosuis]MDY5713551.1 type IV secretion system protein [Fusobacterium gastrosuis]